jgi:lambda repressor-like predicted transcriptional regulator
MVKLTGAELVEQLARQSTEDKQEFAKVLVQKWPNMANDIADMIGYEIQDQNYTVDDLGD